MSNRHPRATVLRIACIAGLLFPYPARVTAQTVEALEHRLEELNVMAREIDAAQPVTPLDTFAIGRLSIVTPTVERTRTADIMRNAWTNFGVPFGSDTSRLDTLSFAIASRTVPEFRGITRHFFVRYSEWEDVESVAKLIGTHIARMVAERHFPDSLIAWLGWGVLRFDSLSADEWTSVYIHAATTRFAVVRECLNGSTQDCTTALGTIVSATPNVDWYTPAEARSLAREHGDSRIHPCVLRPSDETCADWLETYPTDLRPTARFARVALFRLAINAGGEGWLERMAAVDETVGPDSLLATMSGTPTDTLVARWYQNVIAAAPAPTALTTKSALAALVWIVGLTLLSSRSSRWRN